MSKLSLLLASLAANPLEFMDRVRAVIEVYIERLHRHRPLYRPTLWDEVVEQLSLTFGVDASTLDREVNAQALESSIAEAIATLGPSARFTLRHNSDVRLARLCYLVCRALRPEIVVETGVAYGVTTTFILEALKTNGGGRLYSVDLPPLAPGADDAVGALVPPPLRSRWTLVRGASRRVLPPLLDGLPPVNLFVHDSLHTFGNMKAEFDLVHSHRANSFALIADDIESNFAFEGYLEQHRSQISFHATLAAVAKSSYCGLCVLHSRR